MRRVFGLETEYGLVAHQPLEEGSPDDDHARAVSNEEVAWRVVDAVRDLLPSLPDTVGCGAFLSNGSRVYVDGHHLEWATPEVSTPWDLVRCTSQASASSRTPWLGAAAPANRPRSCSGRTWTT